MFMLVLTCDIYFILDSKNTFMLFFFANSRPGIMGWSWKKILTVMRSLYILKGILYKPVRVYFLK